jgi:hypothetical protein
LIAKGTIDEIVFRALNLKQSINDYIRNMGIKFNEK